MMNLLFYYRVLNIYVIAGGVGGYEDFGYFYFTQILEDDSAEMVDHIIEKN